MDMVVALLQILLPGICFFAGGLLMNRDWNRRVRAKYHAELWQQGLIEKDGWLYPVDKHLALPVKEDGE